MSSEDAIRAVVNWSFPFGGLCVLAHLLVVIRMRRKHPDLHLDAEARSQAKGCKRWVMDPASEAIGDSYLLKVVWVRQISGLVAASLIATAYVWTLVIWALSR